MSLSQLSKASWMAPPMDRAHCLGPESVLDCLGDLIELIRWSELNSFMNVSVPLSEIKSVLQESPRRRFGKEIWLEAANLVHKSHQSCVVLARQDLIWRHRRGFRPLAKLFADTEGQLNTCIDVLKVVAFAATCYTMKTVSLTINRDPEKAKKVANDLICKLSTENMSAPISLLLDDPVVRAHLFVREVRQHTRELSLIILRSLREALDSWNHFIVIPFCQQDPQIVERWFPNDNRIKKEGCYESFGGLERRIVDVTNRLERTASSYAIGNCCGCNTNQGGLIPAVIPVIHRMKTCPYIPNSGSVH
ncbi:unnamed protein product [Clonostachys solani]|uniref:Uncharacterized protein n=1 Tax=Clonostachys solani TaxID=160281 RepID=A0A9P0EN82_9HYPO|nr:unnamed protein product [Clonostachys solani]